MTQHGYVISLISAVAIVIASAVASSTFLTSSSFEPIPALLDQTVTLTASLYESDCQLSLTQGDTVHIKVSVSGDAIDFQVVKDEPFMMIIDESDVFSYEQDLTVPSSETYIFYVRTMGNYALVHLTVVKK